MKLTKEQQVAVDHPSSIVLTACPGSGKTRTLVAKLVKEIETLIGSPRAVACITYTNTAVQEIEKRTALQLGYDLETNYAVCTIHSFCLNYILRPFSWRLKEFKRVPTVITPDKDEFEIFVRYAYEKINYLNPSRKDFEQFENINLDKAGKLAGSVLNNEVAIRAVPHFWKKCGDEGYIDFCNIIYKSYCLLRDYEDIRRSIASKFAWILVDEFQDTTDLQTEILKLIFSEGKTKIFAVGDPAQSIFGFAGAKPELIAPFARDIGGRTDLSLSANFRSSQKIVANAEKLFPRNPAMQAAGEDKHYPQNPFLVQTRDTFDAIYNQFIPTISKLNIQLSEASVIAPSWNQIFPLARRLRDAGIPVVGPGARPYKRSRTFAVLAENLSGYLTDPHSDQMRLIEKVVFNSIMDVSGVARFDVYSYSGRVVIAKLLRRSRELLDGRSGIQWLDAMSIESGKILVKCEFLSSSLEKMFYVSVQEMKADMLRNNVDPNKLSIDDLSLFSNSKKSLRLSTIHFSKGREYDAVAMIGLRDGIIPYYQSTDLEADKRLFYVGVTRARKYLMYVNEFHSKAGPSRFLGASGLGLF